MVIDEKDNALLDLLIENSKQTTGRLAKKLNMPATTIHNHIKRMEREGIITGYTLKLDYQKLGKDVLAYILVTVMYLLPSGKKVSQEDVARHIKRLGAEEVDIVTGGSDIIVKMRVKDVQELNDFVVRKLRSVDGVDKTQTMIVLNTL